MAALAIWAAASMSHAAAPGDIAAAAIRDAKLTSVERIDIEQADSTQYRYIVWYTPNRGSPAKAKTDTTRLVRATLVALVAAGMKPSEDWVRIHSHAVEATVGETGKKLAVDYGGAHYNFALDRVEYEAPKR